MLLIMSWQVWGSKEGERCNYLLCEKRSMVRSSRVPDTLLAGQPHHVWDEVRHHLGAQVEGWEGVWWQLPPTKDYPEVKAVCNITDHLDQLGRKRAGALLHLQPLHFRDPWLWADPLHSSQTPYIPPKFSCHSQSTERFYSFYLLHKFKCLPSELWSW